MRVEDDGLLRGTTAFLRDLPHDDCLEVVFVRSTEAHARILGIDTAEALDSPGVRSVLTAADLALPAFRYYEPIPEAFARPLVATDRVRTVGEIVALVVADSQAEATDASELVAVEYDPLPVVVTPADALAPGAPVLFEAAGSNVVLQYDRGRDEELFDGAAHVERLRCPNNRLAPAPLEPSAAIVRPTADGLDVWATSQGVHLAREEIARALGLDEARVRVRAASVGGGFGGRHSAVVEILVLAAAARSLGLPLRWDETRSENLLGMVHGRAQHHELEAGFDDDCRLTALRVRNVADCGAHPHFGPLMPFASRKLACGPYRVPAVEYSWAGVVTNTTPVGPYRGAGQPEATNGLERTMDAAARSLGIDPVDLRSRNLLTPEELPHTTPTRVTYDAGDYPAALERALALVDHDAVRSEQAARRDRNDTVQLGVGVACYVSIIDGRQEFGSVTVDGSGRAQVRCGTLSHGQSHATTVGTVVAVELGMDLGQITYLDRDTDDVPRGHGTGGSRSAQMAGSAALVASREVVRLARETAARLLETDPADVVVMAADADRPAGMGVVGVPASVIGWARLAAEAGPAGLTAEVDVETGGATFASGTHATVVEVDLETGHVAVRAHAAVDDCGAVLNRPVVEGQQHGGAAAGIGQALYESVEYDEDGTPRTTSFGDYLIPSATELPLFRTATMDIPTPLAPNGAKGIGENGAIAAPSSVQNAVVDALAHLGVTHLDLPVTPERVWRAVRGAAGDGDRRETGSG